MADGIDLDASMRGLLVSWGLLDSSAMHKSNRARASSQSAPEPSMFGRVWQSILPYMPIRKMSDEEWEAYEKKQASRMTPPPPLLPRAMEGPGSKHATTIDTHTVKRKE
jgi:hypothetical protein